MRIVVPTGGTGGARFVRGLLRHLAAAHPGSDVTVIGNTGDDITLFGLRVCPDLDTVMYTLGGGIHEDQGWGRANETYVVKEELAAYGATPQWFGLGDRDMATHIVRTQMLAAGTPLSTVTAALCERWGLPRLGVRLLPMSDEPFETHVVIEDDQGERTVHFQEYWVRLHAEVTALDVVSIGGNVEAGPGVLDAIRDADVVVIPPSNPVVSIGSILSVYEIEVALRRASAAVVGLSPIVGGAPLRGMADKVLAAVGVESSASAVALHYGSRRAGGLLDGWLVDSRDAGAVAEVEAAGIACRAVPLLMRDVDATAAMAAAALDLAESARATA